MNTIKSKVLSVADKVTNSKVYKGVEKVLVCGSAALMTVSGSAITSFAAELDNTLQNQIATAASADSILNNATPFIVPGITILCIVGGIKLGMRFLRSSMH